MTSKLDPKHGVVEPAFTDRRKSWSSSSARAGHVDAIGGRDRIQKEVQPALMEQIGDLLYIQLTAWIDDAWTPEMWNKRLKLRQLMEPILVPA